MHVPSTLLGLTALISCVFELRQGSVAAASCTFQKTTTCFKVHLNDMTTNLTALTRKQGAELDAAVTNYTRRFSAAFQCFSPEEARCAKATEKQFIGRVQNSSDLLVKELTNKTVLTSIVTAFNCYNVDHFTPCMSRAVRDFLSEPLKASNADIKELCRNMDNASKSCLVARNCTATVQAGKKAAQKLLTCFRNIWGCKGGNGASARTSSVAIASMMLLVPLFMRKML